MYTDVRLPPIFSNILMCPIIEVLGPNFSKMCPNIRVFWDIFWDILASMCIYMYTTIAF